jgi:hypothetical protein
VENARLRWESTILRDAVWEPRAEKSKAKQLQGKRKYKIHTKVELMSRKKDWIASVCASFCLFYNLNTLFIRNGESANNYVLRL